jgi:hypothetical protein
MAVELEKFDYCDTLVEICLLLDEDYKEPLQLMRLKADVNGDYGDPSIAENWEPEPLDLPLQLEWFVRLVYDGTQVFELSSETASGSRIVMDDRPTGKFMLYVTFADLSTWFPPGEVIKDLRLAQFLRLKNGTEYEHRWSGPLLVHPRKTITP